MCNNLCGQKEVFNVCLIVFFSLSKKKGQGQERRPLAKILYVHIVQKTSAVNRL